MKFITVVLITSIKKAITDEDEFPKLEDLFPAVGPHELSPMKNVNIDLNRLDVEKFMKKLQSFESEVKRNTSLSSGDWLEWNITAFEMAKDARRASVPYISQRQFTRASKYMNKVKACDLMIQLVYMARYKVRQLEEGGYYNNKDTGYRVAFLYRRLRILWRRIMNLYTMQVTKMDNWFKYLDVDEAMLVHMKIIRLYEDFMFLWWVLIAVDGKYQETFKKRRVRVKKNKGKSSSNSTSGKDGGGTEKAALKSEEADEDLEQKMLDGSITTPKDTDKW